MRIPNSLCTFLHSILFLISEEIRRASQIKILVTHCHVIGHRWHCTEKWTVHHVITRFEPRKRVTRSGISQTKTRIRKPNTVSIKSMPRFIGNGACDIRWQRWKLRFTIIKEIKMRM
ncbi:hypothetical protein V8G54_011138 [Vigna mungo]|uniref:Uncharacterized protein n=1 Tax=Vigna mungo TaxID=3915 RepID=A0AAQ3NR04_VIGMU